MCLNGDKERHRTLSPIPAVLLAGWAEERSDYMRTKAPVPAERKKTSITIWGNGRDPHPGHGTAGGL